MANLLTIENKRELLALHWGLVALKHGLEPEGDLPPEPYPDLPVNPFFADLCERVVEALIGLEEQRNRPKRAGRWRQWRRAEGHPHVLAAVRQRLMAMPPAEWQGWSDEQKRGLT